MDTRMRSKARKQRKFVNIFSAPAKILCKARDACVKGMENCTNQVTYGALVGYPSAPAVRLPKSYSVNSFTALDDEEFRKLLQTSMLPRSYSFSVGKIGTIDEEEPCAFEEDGLKAKLLYPRSRSHVVRRN